MFTRSMPFAVCVLASAIGALSSSAAFAQQDEAQNTEETIITGIRNERESRGATGLEMTLFDTPQSVTQIDRDFIDSFDLVDVNTVLKLTTGVNVDEVETDRTYYNSRGFDIKSMQVDGHGMPFNWNVVGDLDTVVYERVEVIRGANGLLTGTGNPSGTINYIRKRPTNDFQASAKVSVGDWDYKRAEADVSVPLNDSASWAARVVAAALDTDSYLNNYSKDRQVVYGVVDGQLSRNMALAVGGTYQTARSEGVLWGALPLLDTNGNQVEHDVSDSTTMDWTWWETESRNLWAELTVQLGSWDLVATLTDNQYDEPSELFYTYGSYDSETKLGLFGYPGKYFSETSQQMADLLATGSYGLFGRDHDLALGLNISQSENGYLQYSAPLDSPAWGPTPAFPWDGDEIARPDFGEGEVQSDFNGEVRRAYAVTRLHATDALAFILGVNGVEATSEGYSFGDSMDWEESDVAPYVGAVYTFSNRLNLYASYSDIFEPQSELNENLQNIGAAEGTSYELGLKKQWLDDNLLTTLSIFKAEQENYATYGGFDAESGLSWYYGEGVESTGFEFEVGGFVGEEVELTAGYTQMSLEGDDGEDVRTFVPRRTLKAAVRYQPRFLAQLDVGANYRWQSEISNGGIEQGSYGVFSVYASYDVLKNLELLLNIDNVTDEKYLNSLYWTQSYYGEPRNIKLSAKLSF